MNEADIRKTTLEVLASVAPESAGQDLDPHTAFRDQFDFDSVDFLNFALALDKALNVEIPETDYPSLSSLNGCVSYLSGMLREKA
jgi:acyl carrier protein